MKEDEQYCNERYSTLAQSELNACQYFVIHWNFPNAWYVTIRMCNCAGVRAGNEHLTESVQKLPKELVIPNDQIKLLDSIGQGEPSCMDYELALAEYCNSFYVYMPGTTQICMHNIHS